MAPVKKAVTKKAAATKAAAKTAKPKTAAKKPAATKPAATKPVAKKTTATKKPAAKKTAAKSTATVKKAAVKKTAAKAATAKKPAAKKAVVKTAAVKKSTVKKAEVKKEELKTAVEKKPAAKIPAEKKTPVVKEPAAGKKAEPADSSVKYRNLFEAYAQQKLPFAHGYIVSSFFNEKNAYSIYEIVSYAGVKELHPSENGLLFVAGGKKLHVLVEHDTYQFKFQEPVSRTEGEKIPQRFSELEIITAKNQTKIMVAKEPKEITSSFTILKPASLNFAVIFDNLPDVYQSLAAFFESSLNKQRKVPQADAKKSANLIAATVEKTMSFKGDFE